MPFVEQLRAGYDLVMGNRFRGGIRPGAMPPLNRYLGNPVLTGLGRMFFNSPIGDFHCGLRGFSKAAVERMRLQTTGMEFASEMIVKATLLRLRVTEVPTTLSPDGRSRRPHLRPWRDGWRHLRFLLLFSPRWLFLYPGFLLMLAGFVVSCWVLPGPRTLFGVTFDVHTLVFATAAVLIGFQAVNFAVFTKIFAVTTGLHPAHRTLHWLLDRFTMEGGLVIGAILVAAGLGGSVYAFSGWRELAFGPLDTSQMLRLVVPSVLCLTMGCQVILSSFFLSVLGLKHRQ
jgi:hypothetical protein